jgi:hypothetical protein
LIFSALFKRELLFFLNFLTIDKNDRWEGVAFSLSSALFLCENSSGNAECGNGAARGCIILVEPDPQRQVALALTLLFITYSQLKK